MAFTTMAPSVRAPARVNAAVVRAVPRKMQNAVASVLAAVPLVLAPTAVAGDLELPKIDYDSSVVMDNERSSQTQFNEPDYNTVLEKANAKAEKESLPDVSSKNTKDFVEGAKRFIVNGDLGALPTDAQSSAEDIAAATEKNLNKAGNKAEAVTSDGPLTAAKEGAKNAGASAKEVGKNLGLPDVGALPTDAQSSAEDIAAATEKNLDKAGNKAETVTSDGPLAAARESAKNAGASAKEVGKNLGVPDVGAVDVQQSAMDVAADAEKNLSKAGNAAKEVTSDGPLSAAKEGAANAGEEAKAES